MPINNIFKSLPPKEDIINILNKAINENETFIINKNFYKQLVFNKNLEKLIDILKLHYKPNMVKLYLNRVITYTNFCTIIRHICRVFSFPYFYKIIYNKSIHEVVYYLELL